VTPERAESHKAVEELVAHYQAKARAVSRTGVAVGAFVGVLVGSIPLSPLRAAWPIPSSYGFATVLGGLVVGVLIGYVIGDPRAKLYQRMAEQARLQLQLEQRITQNDARMAQLLTALTARAAAAAQRPAAPQPAAAQPVVTQPVVSQPVAPAPPPVQQLQPVQPAYEPPPRLRTVSAQQAQAAPPLSPPVSS
jgi:predicted lipid-binding transport protein (Tim44 family)